MKRSFLHKRFVICCIVFLFLTTPVLAYSVPDSTIVYVTPSGTKYHREDCSYTNSVRAMTVKEAERKGYDPCSRCDPDVLTGEYHSNWDRESSKSSGSKTTNNSEGKPSTNVPASKEEPAKQKKDVSIGGIAINLIAVLFMVLFALSTLESLYLFLYGWLVCGGVIDRIKKIFKRK